VILLFTPDTTYAFIRVIVELTRDLSGSRPEKDPSGLHDTCVHYSFVKEQARDLREFGCLRPNRETSKASAACQCKILR